MKKIDRPNEPDNQQERYRTEQDRLEIGQIKSEPLIIRSEQVRTGQKRVRTAESGVGGVLKMGSQPNHMFCIVYTHGIKKALHS